MTDLRTRWSEPFRLLALVVALTLAVTIAAPAKAEADVLAGLAIAGLVVAGVILIAYLVIASVDSSQRGAGGQVIWLACGGDDCAEVVARAAPGLVPVGFDAPDGSVATVAPATRAESP
jgi:hypothetical protein